MTLVELLVVTGLMAVLLGLLVVGLRGGSKGVEPLPSVLAAAHGRALGVPEGAAVILATGTGSEPNAAVACTTLFEATMLPLIEATVTGIPPSSPESVTATATVMPWNGEDVERAYKILLFGGRDCPVAAPPTAWLAFTPPSTLAFRLTYGQTTNNTVWPKPSASGAFDAVLAQYPAKSSAAFEMQQGMAIDLRFSGIGDDRSTTYGRLAPDDPKNDPSNDKGAIAIVFDRVGRVAEVIQQVPDPGQPATAGAAQPAMPIGTIYFLVVPRDQIVAAVDSNTLASGDAKWVALVPQTGQIFVADNVIQMDTTAAALRAARAKVRQGIGVGK